MGYLYIIGNGFDLNHGLETDYHNYRKYLIEHQPDVVRNFENNEYMLYSVSVENEDLDLWSDLEGYLEITDYEDYFDYASQTYYPNLNEDNPGWNDLNVDVTINFDFLRQLSQSCFYDWITEQAGKRISGLRNDINNDGRFIVFNYTKTLEKNYGISEENCLHIHGTIDDHTSIVFGTPKNDPLALKSSLEKTYGNDEFYGAVYAYAVEQFANIAESAFKDIESKYDELRRFIQKSGDIEEVLVMGHALNGLDIPYYENVIVPLLNDRKWKIYLYSDKDREKAKEFVEKYRIQTVEYMRW